MLGAAAFVASVILTLLVRRWALRRGFVDQPGHRKIHAKPIALGGGIVIFWVTILPLALVAVLALWWQRSEPPTWLPQELTQHMAGVAYQSRRLLILIAAAAVLHITGLIDDKRHLGPTVKLVVQLAVATILATAADIRFSFFISNVYITSALSVIWMVIIINAFNFLDNMDGLSAGIGLICGAMILAAAAASGQVFVGGLLVLLMGALGGFLIFNFSPAKIFMGDSGSLLLGLLLAVATIRTTYFHHGITDGRWFGACMPLVVLAVPLYDFISVTVLRLLSGASPFVGDTRHFSHRLVRRGMSQRQAVLTIYLATACTGLSATFLHQVSQTGMALILLQTVLIVMIIAILEQPGGREGENHQA